MKSDPFFFGQWPCKHQCVANYSIPNTPRVTGTRVVAANAKVAGLTTDLNMTGLQFNIVVAGTLASLFSLIIIRCMLT